MNVCFLPGSLCDARVFGPQIAAATAQGHYCCVIDLTTESSIEAMARRVIESTRPGVVLVGLSMGAIVAAEVVSQAPGHASAIALFDTNLAAPSAEQLDRRARWDRDVRAGHFARVVSSELTDALTAWPERNRELIFDMAMATGPQGFLHQNRALQYRPDRRDNMADFDGPILVASGSADQFCSPALHQELAERMPNASHITIENAGHLATIDQPHELNTALVQWLTFCTKQIHTQEGTHEYEFA